MQTSIALVGLGGYGEVYINQLLSEGARNQAVLAAGIDPAPERCTRLAELRAAGIPIFPSLESFFQNKSADLVIISAPIHLHAPLTTLALSRGAHVLCEKPLAGSLADARKMIKAEQSSGRIVAIGYQWSFSDAILALKRDILAGHFGRPLRCKTITLWPRWKSYYQRNDWAGKIRTANGAWVLDSPLHNATAHYLHNMLFLLGPSLECSVAPASEEVELYRANPIENYDTAALRVHTQPGIELLFFTAHPVYEQCGPLIQCEFEDAVIEYPGNEGSFTVHFRNGAIRDYGSPESTPANKLWSMLQAIQTGSRPVCGIQTALPQLLCAAGAQQGPIRSFPADLVCAQMEENDSLTWIEGLSETLLDCFENNRLPSETPGVSWATGKTRVDFENL